MSSPNLGLIQRSVLHIITKYPEAVNDRPLLLERYWVEINGWQEGKSLYWNLTRVTRPGTIDRRVRELRTAGLITQSAERDKECMEAMKNEQDHASPMQHFFGDPMADIDNLITQAKDIRS